MRVPAPHGARGAELDSCLTPMIDVIFQLLIFFIWTSSFQIAEQALPSQLRETSGRGTAAETPVPPPEADFDRVVVRIGWVNQRPVWLLNDIPLASLPQVRERLQQVAAIRRDAPLIVHPDPDVPLGHVIDVYDLARLAGFTKIQFAASEAL
jgi:biopolymer transport protein ExbD